MQDAEMKKDAQNFLFYVMRTSLKSKEDTLNYVNEMKALYAQEPENDEILGNLFSIYDGMKDKAAQTALLDNHLAKYPNSYIALANKGLMAMSDNNADEGAAWFKKAVASNPENAAVQTYLGICLNAQAGASDDAAKRKALYQEAIAAFNKAKQLDPNKQQVNWGYNRYQAFYNLYGADAPETKEAELDAK
jgi:tetratricopeptide (TPR) repeat protein